MNGLRFDPSCFRLPPCDKDARREDSFVSVIPISRVHHQIRSRAKSWRPDVILMDIIWPGINGVDATKAIRNNPSTAQIPIIAYSALPVVGWKEQALKAGMVAYLQKPIKLQLLMETIQKFIPS